MRGVVALVSLYVRENYGVRLLASVLRKAGIAVTEIYFQDYFHHAFRPPSRRELEALATLLKERNPAVVGLSLRAGGYVPAFRRIAAAIRGVVDAPLIAGGMHASAAPGEALDGCDAVITGEGETAFVDAVTALLEGRSLEGVTNVVTVSEAATGERALVRNPLAPPVRDLDSLPFRDFHSHGDKFFIDGAAVTAGDPCSGDTVFLMLASRGCPFQCTYCDVTYLKELYGPNIYRVRSPESVIQEIEYARAHLARMRRIRFDDELFPFRDEWLREFARLYRARVGLPFEIHWDPRVMRPEGLRTLREAGLDCVYLGIQGSTRVNRDFYRRDVSRESLVEGARVLHREKIRSAWHVILDDPFSTTEDREEILDTLLAMPRPYDLYLFSLCHFPGTALTASLLDGGAIAAGEVEGRSGKALEQFRADLRGKRPPEETFWLCIYSLASKSFIPKGLVRALARMRLLRRRPFPLEVAFMAANYVKLGANAAAMLVRGELTLSTVRRWVNFRSPPTS